MVEDMVVGANVLEGMWLRESGGSGCLRQRDG